MDRIAIPINGLLAGERYLRRRCEEFDDGTWDGFHMPFIADLLSEVFRESHIAFEMPPNLHRRPEGILS